MKSVYLLSDASDPVAVECPDCGRHGRYSKARAISEHGDIALPDFLAEVSKDCPRRMFGTNGAACRARFAPESIIDRL